MSKQMTSFEDVKRYVDGGWGTFTVRSRKTQTRYTFKMSKPEESWDESDITFVRVLTSDDNEDGYLYLGFIRDREMIAGRKGHPDAPSFKALQWVIAMLARDNESLMDCLEFWHEGTCGRCGRKLTVPESIDRGLGPVCAKAESVNAVA